MWAGAPNRRYTGGMVAYFVAHDGDIQQANGIGRRGEQYIRVIDDVARPAPDGCKCGDVGAFFHFGPVDFEIWLDAHSLG